MPTPFPVRISPLAPALAAALWLAAPTPDTLAQRGAESPAPVRIRADRQPQASQTPPVEPADLSGFLPEEAQVTLTSGALRVVAKNSSLVPILEDIAHMSGIEIINLPDESPLVSGDYGPAGVRTILVDLISDAGYNFVMVGGTGDAAPTKLLLEKPSKIARSAAVARGAPPALPASGRDQTDEPPYEEPLGPGALRPTPADAPVDENDRIRRNLQRLQHIQQQQQQNAPQ